jgi:hypothetical protein
VSWRCHEALIWPEDVVCGDAGRTRPARTPRWDRPRTRVEEDDVEGLSVLDLFATLMGAAGLVLA